MTDRSPANQLARTYVRGCSELGLNPVAEFVQVLNTSPSQRSKGVECVITQQINPLTDQDLVNIASSLQHCNFITLLALRFHFVPSDEHYHSSALHVLCPHNKQIHCHDKKTKSACIYDKTMFIPS